jgi:hypothetical protein
MVSGAFFNPGVFTKREYAWKACPDYNLLLTSFSGHLQKEDQLLILAEAFFLAVPGKKATLTAQDWPTLPFQ